MGIFSSIMSKLGFGDEEQTENKITAEAPAVENAASEPETVESAIEAMPEIDVIAKLESLSADNPGLNWQTSIVDLLKLLGLDSAYAHRKELAAEMGIDGYEGTAEQNIALHKTVLAKIAENGGNIPQELL